MTTGSAHQPHLSQLNVVFLSRRGSRGDCRYSFRAARHEQPQQGLGSRLACRSPPRPPPFPPSITFRTPFRFPADAEARHRHHAGRGRAVDDARARAGPGLSPASPRPSPRRTCPATMRFGTRLPRRRGLFRIEGRAAVGPARGRRCDHQPHQVGPLSRRRSARWSSSRASSRSSAAARSRRSAANAQYRTAIAIAQGRAGRWRGTARPPNALYFHARRVSPGWGRARVATIGNHIFYPLIATRVLPRSPNVLKRGDARRVSPLSPDR